MLAERWLFAVALARGGDQVINRRAAQFHHELEKRHLAQAPVGVEDVALHPVVTFRLHLSAVKAHELLQRLLRPGERGGGFASRIGGGPGAGIGERLAVGRAGGAGQVLAKRRGAAV